MELFKFRSFREIEFALDIIFNERLHCAPHQELNDPFEGLISTIEWKGGGLVRPLARPLARPLVRDLQGNWPQEIYKSLGELPNLDNNRRICSLSSDMTDVRLWSHYAAGHTGFAIKIKIDFDTCPQLYEVTYAPGFKKFTDEMSGETTASDILSFKTDHWDYEKEYRIITESEFFPVKEQIAGIYLGIRASEIHKEMLIRCTPKNIPIYDTQLDQTSVKIQSKVRVN
jgi:hypothetical protein